MHDKILASLLMLVLLGCGPSKSMPLTYPHTPGESPREDFTVNGVAPPTSQNEGPDFERNIRLIFQRRCDSCHNSQSALPNWQDYSTVLAKRDSLTKRFIQDRTMPPAPLDRVVPDEERRIVDDWFKAGAPRTTASAPLPLPQTSEPKSSPTVTPTQTANVPPPILTAGLALAVAQGNLESVKKFLSDGADPNELLQTTSDSPHSTFNGMPALMVAIKNAYPGMVATLLGYGANSDVKLSDGTTALDLASQIAIEPYKNAILAMLKSSAEGGALTRVTYSKNIKPIFQRRCVMCHNEQAIPATNWMSFDNAFAERILIYARTVVIKDMPIGNVTGMTDEEREVVTNWVRSGGLQ